MISTRLAGLFAGIALAIGLVVGAAGAIVAREAVTPTAVSADWDSHMQGMASMMGGSNGMMGGSAGMMGSGAITMPDWMLEHHGLASPEPAP